MFEAVLPIWRFCLHRENWRRKRAGTLDTPPQEDDPTGAARIWPLVGSQHPRVWRSWKANRGSLVNFAETDAGHKRRRH